MRDEDVMRPPWLRRDGDEHACAGIAQLGLLQVAQHLSKQEGGGGSD